MSTPLKAEVCFVSLGRFIEKILTWGDKPEIRAMAIESIVIDVIANFASTRIKNKAVKKLASAVTCIE